MAGLCATAAGDTQYVSTSSLGTGALTLQWTGRCRLWVCGSRTTARTGRSRAHDRLVHQHGAGTRARAR